MYSSDHQAARRINMRWQLMTGWPIGGTLLPPGTVISDDGDPLAMPLSAVPLPLPIVAKAMDPAAAEQMLHWHDETNTIGGWHELHFAHGIDHKAIKAKVRHAKRFPGGVARWGPIAERPQPISKRKDPTDAEVPPKAIETNPAQAKTHKAKARQPAR
jgi:hypothetical protein